MQPIIQSLLDTDLYKYTMMQCVFHYFKDAKACYQLSCRSNQPTAMLKAPVSQQLAMMDGLTLNQEELEYLASLPYFKDDFLAYLASYQLNAESIAVGTEHDALTLMIEGPWLDTILFEVPLLATISECYSQTQSAASHGQSILQDKIAYLEGLEAGFGFTDFGTRRRYSKAWHSEVLQTLQAKAPARLRGTSNLMLAKALKLPAVGTMAHEYLQAAQVLAPSLAQAQAYALEIWLQEYGDQLAIALTDCITMDAFLKTFDKALATRYHGLRQDSGDPFEWTEKALAHYRRLGINPKEKRFVYSDRLSFEKAYQLYQRYQDQAKIDFGIGTYLTHDVGFKPLDIVIKLYHLNDKPVVKISDSPSKIICDNLDYLAKVKETFEIE